MLRSRVLLGIMTTGLLFALPAFAQEERSALLEGDGNEDASELPEFEPPPLFASVDGSRRSFSLLAGGAAGLAILGSQERHDLALLSLAHGWRISPVYGEGRWYRGFVELRLELFAGAQVSPDLDWLVGLTPHLRYNFLTGSRWMPFVDVGAGVSATGIGPPDLSGTFEFNEQAGVGVQYFLTGRTAVTVETRFMHMSCAGINEPNLGLNAVMGFLGITWFY